MTKPDPTTGNYIVWFYVEQDILTNCILALAEYRRHVGEYWPKKIVVNRLNRLSISMGADIEIIKPKKSESNWPILNAVYMSTDEPHYDPAVVRKATVPNVLVRQPIEDVYQAVYKRRNEADAGFYMKLPT